MTGLPPFNCKDFVTLKELVTKSKYEFPKDIDPDAKSLIEALLKKNPDSRLGASLKFEALKAHPFFKSIDFDKLMKCELTAPYKPSY